MIQQVGGLQIRKTPASLQMFPDFSVDNPGSGAGCDYQDCSRGFSLDHLIEFHHETPDKVLHHLVLEVTVVKHHQTVAAGEGSLLSDCPDEIE